MTDTLTIETLNQISKHKTAYTNLEKERDELKKDFATKEDKLLNEILESQNMVNDELK